MAVTFTATVGLAAVASWLGIATPTLTTNSFGAALTLGDLVQTGLAAAIGALVAFALNRHKHNER